MERYPADMFREQKIRRDRRRKDVHKPGSSSSTQDDASKDKKGVDPSNREAEDKPSQEVAKTLVGEKCAEAKDVPVFDFASLKRETDEITAMTSKKFSKRQVYSNWSRYEELSEAHEAWKEEKNPSADFESLLNAPVSAGGHFKFKSERSWDVNPASLYSEYFALDLDTISQGLACIPFYQKLDLPKSLFSGLGRLYLDEVYPHWCRGRVEKCLGKTTLSAPNQDSNLDLPIIGSAANCKTSVLDHVSTEGGESLVKNLDEELEKMEYFVKQSAVRYSAASTTKKNSQSVNDKPVTTKLINILSYKENNQNTDPSMYENFDEDVQLENKSLVSFSFEPKIVSQTGESVTISVPSINLNSLNRDSISENVVIHNKLTKPTLSDTVLGQTTSQASKDNVSLTEKVQNNIAQDKINATKLTAHRIESNEITINTYKTEERSAEEINGNIEIDLSEEDTPPAKCLSAIVAEGSKPEDGAKPIEQAPGLLDQRPSRQKKGHRKVGKSEKVETFEGKEPKIKLEEKKAIIENEKLTVSSKNNDAKQKEKCIEDRKLEEKKIKQDVEKARKNDKVHKEEVMKGIEVVVKASGEGEDDLDFLLSLKKPVAEVASKLQQSGKQGRSAIEAPHQLETSPECNLDDSFGKCRTFRLPPLTPTNPTIVSFPPPPSPNFIKSTLLAPLFFMSAIAMMNIRGDTVPIWSQTTDSFHSPSDSIMISWYMSSLRAFSHPVSPHTIILSLLYDEADETNLLLLSSNVKKDENLEDWLDSMLDD
uniref:Uncharacterized protein n=1 Tax=Timema douglasi TaxID=61478 RepID=A0A7R8Z9W1_TIMDO|nr:unnamed protein product [Timema douglasi]